ncbi:MAG TPA: nucleotidyltransferase domain-containing protein [Phycisphaerales bacterium]|nr:nucleotidyltransferase domain-containing protein [Phycisphaerales bacterium]
MTATSRAIPPVGRGAEAANAGVDQNVIKPYLDAHPAPLLFVTVSGAHLYGFASADSDYDLRGCHVTPVRRLVGLSPPDETHQVMDKAAPIEVDLVTHDVRKFFSLLLKNNGYVLEQVCSPLIVHRTPEFEELRSLADRCVTKNHKHHFLRFSMNQWEMVVKGGRPTVKGLLYTYRVLLSGIRLMRTGRVESNLRTLNEDFRLAYIDDLIARKTAGMEKDVLSGEDLALHEREFTRLCDELESARAASSLPEAPDCRAELDDLLVRIRMKHLQ